MSTTAETRTIAPRVDVYEDAHAFTIQAEMPGVERGNARIEVNDGTLTLHGTRALTNGSTTPHIRERARGEYLRSFTLGKGFDLERVQAQMNNGLLTITLPKAEKLQRKSININ